MPLAIIAGNGSMPGEIRDRMMAEGSRPLLIGIRGEVDPALERDCERVLSFGQLGSLFDLLGERGVRHVLFAGGIVRRPDFKSIRLDMMTLRELPSLLRIVMGGDDSVLSKIATFMGRHGLAVVGVADAAPSLLAGEGQIAGPPLKGRMPAALKDTIDLAWKGARLVGSLDAGQGCIAVDGRVVALEGAEGTDAMMGRLGPLRQERRIHPDEKWSVLAKVTKPGQDMRADLPAIGPETLEGAARNGINHVVVEAGRSVVLGKTRLSAVAEQHGIRVIGMRASGTDA